MQLFNDFQSILILIGSLSFLFPVTIATPRFNEQESRLAVLDNTYHCARSVVFNMPSLRLQAEAARNMHKENFYKPWSQRPEFPKLFVGRIYGCRSESRCLQWPLPHRTHSNGVSPYRLILSDIMSPLGVARLVVNPSNAQAPRQDSPIRSQNAQIPPQNQLNRRQRIENYVPCQMIRVPTSDRVRS